MSIHITRNYNDDIIDWLVNCECNECEKQQLFDIKEKAILRTTQLYQQQKNADNIKQKNKKKERKT